MTTPQPDFQRRIGHGLDDHAAMDTFSVRLPRWPVIWMSGRNPLIRVSDRVEALVAVLAVVVSLVAVPIAAALGTAVHDSRSRVYAQQAQARHLVTATVTDGKAVRKDLSKPSVNVPARWFAGGAEHTGTVSAPLKVKTGDSIDIWVDNDGSLVGPPSRTAMDEAVAAALVFWVVVALAAGGVCAATRVVLDRIRNFQGGRERLGIPTTNGEGGSRQLRTRSTSLSGRRGVGGGTSSMAGATPTRIRTWGRQSWSSSTATRSRVTRSSVR